MNVAGMEALDARFDHAAVAAPKIRDLLRIYRDLLGGEFVNGGDNPRVGYRALQLRYPNDKRIELMEPLPESRFFDSFFKNKPDGGLHHVTYLVGDIRRALATVRQHGFTPVGIYLQAPWWREAFLHPSEANGVLIQLAEKDEQHMEDEYGDVTLDAVLNGTAPQGNGVPSP